MDEKRREQNREAQRRRRERLAQQGLTAHGKPRTSNRQPNGSFDPSNPDDPRHGTYNGYNNLHCRCPRCREANRVTHFDYIQRPAVKERRRVRYDEDEADA